MRKCLFKINFCTFPISFPLEAGKVKYLIAIWQKLLINTRPFVRFVFKILNGPIFALQQKKYIIWEFTWDIM
jgi:hypothetical protein